MTQWVNKNLITLKCVLFCFLSGIGCIFPFLPLHMLSVGLDRGEARLISIVAPCIALLGPALLGPLIDRLSVGRGSTGPGSSASGSGRLLRLVTALCLILSAVFYTLLLTIPYTERHEARRPQVLFMCDADSAYVMQEVCKEDMRCNRWVGEKSGVLAVSGCEYGCADENMTWVRRPFTTTSTTSTIRPMYNSVANVTTVSPALSTTEDNDENERQREGLRFEAHPPHLCYAGQCLVYMQHVDRMRMPLSLLAPPPPQDNSSDGDWCTYRTSGPSKCLVPEERMSEIVQEDSPCRPAVRCQVLDPYDEPDGVLADAECRLVIGDPDYTFWLYFLIRILADIFPTTALALLGAACVIATRETSLGRGDVGRQLAIGAIGLAVLPPLAGLAADNMPEAPYIVPFVLHAMLMLVGALILIFDSRMPLSTPEWWWHTASGVLALPMSAVRRYGAEISAVFLVVTLLGVLWSGIDAYLPWRVEELGGSRTELGLTLTLGTLPAVPALFWAEALVDYIGHSNVFISAFVFYAIRYTGLANSTGYAWVAVCEVLEVFTLSLTWVTAVLYFRHLVPRKHTVAGQALPVIAHFCLGRCVGAIISGLSPLEPREAWRWCAGALGVCALVAATVYLALYHAVLAPRCAAPAAAPSPHLLQGLNTNGGSNGTYSPMRVYHEERSRKGHFRY